MTSTSSPRTSSHRRLRCHARGCFLSIHLLVISWSLMLASCAVIFSDLAEESKQNCCLNNHFGKVLRRLELSCEQAGPGDVVQIPPIMDDGELYQTDAKYKDPRSQGRLDSILTPADIHDLKRVALLHHNCTLVNQSEAALHVEERKRYTHHPPHYRYTGKLACWLYTHFKVPDNIMPRLRACAHEMAEVFGQKEIAQRTRNPLRLLQMLSYTAVHARVEGDFPRLCEKISRTHGMKFCYTSRDIARFIQESEHFNSTAQNFVLLHGPNLPLSDLLGSGNHPYEVWQHSFPGSRVFDKAMANCTSGGFNEGKFYNQAAFLDMVLAFFGRKFIGSHLSTFTIGVNAMRDCSRTGRGGRSRGGLRAPALRHHHISSHHKHLRPGSEFVYSCPAELLGHPEGLLPVRNHTAASDVPNQFLAGCTAQGVDKPAGV